MDDDNKSLIVAMSRACAAGFGEHPEVRSLFQTKGSIVARKLAAGRINAIVRAETPGSHPPDPAQDDEAPEDEERKAKQSRRASKARKKAKKHASKKGASRAAVFADITSMSAMVEKLESETATARQSAADEAVEAADPNFCRLLGRTSAAEIRRESKARPAPATDAIDRSDPVLARCLRDLTIGMSPEQASRATADFFKRLRARGEVA